MITEDQWDKFLTLIDIYSEYPLSEGEIIEVMLKNTTIAEQVAVDGNERFEKFIIERGGVSE